MGWISGAGCGSTGLSSQHCGNKSILRWRPPWDTQGDPASKQSSGHNNEWEGHLNPSNWCSWAPPTPGYYKSLIIRNFTINDSLLPFPKQSAARLCLFPRGQSSLCPLLASEHTPLFQEFILHENHTSSSSVVDISLMPLFLKPFKRLFLLST